MSKPKQPMSQPLMGSSPTMLPDIATPNRASQKNSNAPNDKAISAKDGVNMAKQITPNKVPVNAPEVAMPMARPACP